MCNDCYRLIKSNSRQETNRITDSSGRKTQFRYELLELVDGGRTAIFKCPECRTKISSRLAGGSQWLIKNEII